MFSTTYHEMLNVYLGCNMSDHKIQNDRILGGRYVATAFISPCQLWPYWLHPFVVGGNGCIANSSKYRLCQIIERTEWAYCHPPYHV